jgi:hypothetical protein
VTLVVTNPEFLLDQVRHPRAGPQRSLVAQCLRPAQQQPFQPLALLSTESGLSSGAPGLAQAVLTTFSILRHPTHHGLPGDLHPPGHFGLIQTFVQQTNGLEAALLQRLKVASNSGRVSHTRIDAVSPQNVTLYYARFNSRHKQEGRGGR